MKSPDSLPIAFVGGVPAHYMRNLHIEVERRYGDRVHFYYVCDKDTAQQRQYEHGSYPNNCTFLPSTAHIALCKEVFRLNPSLVVFHGHYPRATATLLAAMVISGRRLAYWSDTNLLDVLNRSIIRRAVVWIIGRTLVVRAFALLSIGTANYFFFKWLVGVPKKRAPRIYRVPYPHVVEKFEPALLDAGAAEGEVRVLYVGRLAPEKNIETLIEAIGLVDAGLLGSVRCNIVGDGPLRSNLEEAVRHRGLGGIVKFVGAVRSDQVAAEFAAADIFVLPSHREPWGLVINEAMSTGIPVLASRTAGAAIDLVHDGVTGFQFDPCDSKQLAARLTELILHADQRRRLGAQGRALVSEGCWSLHGALKGLHQVITDSDRAE